MSKKKKTAFDPLDPARHTRARARADAADARYFVALRADESHSTVLTRAARAKAWDTFRDLRDQI